MDLPARVPQGNVSPARFGLLHAAVFLDLVGFGMLIPDVQLRAEAMGAQGWLIGLLLASMFVTQLIFSPRWGAASDRLGRKHVFLACTGLSALGMLVYGLHDSLLLILASRLLGGLGAANVAVANAWIADLSHGEDQTKAMGRLAAATTSGLILGPVVTSVLAQAEALPWLGAVGCAFSALGFVLVALFVPNTAPPAARSPGRRPIIDLRILSDLPQLRSMALIALVAWFSLAMLQGTFGRLIHLNLGYGQREFGLIFGYESLLEVVAQGVLLGWLTSKIADRHLLRAAYVIQGVGLALTPFMPDLLALFGASTLYALGIGLANLLVNTMCSRLTPEDRQGEMFGTLQGARSVGFMIGPVLGGVLFDAAPAAPYALAGVVCVAAALMVRGIPEKPSTGSP